MQCQGKDCTRIVDVDIESDDVVDEVFLCKKCKKKVYRAIDQEGMYWLTAHLQKSHIMFSTHPHLLPVSQKPFQIEDIPEGYSIDQALNSAAEVILTAEAVLIISGAGMSADSGLPVFRGPDGIYEVSIEGSLHRITMNDFDFHEASCKVGLAWGITSILFEKIRSCHPHEGYQVLNDLFVSESGLQVPSFVMTSNIDGYFINSGFDEESVFECHGSAHYLQCTSVGTDYECEADVWKIPEDQPLPHYDLNSLIVTDRQGIPRCPVCGQLARPNVSHITDQENDICQLRKSKQYENLMDWLDENIDKRFVILEIGCGTSSHSLREESELLLSILSNGCLIRIDPQDARVPSHQIPIMLPAKEALLTLQNKMLSLKN